MIDKEYEDQIANLPYRCQTCEKEFNVLDMLTLDKNMEQIPICDVCSGELQLDQKAADSTGTSEKYTRYTSHCHTRKISKLRFVNSFMNECKPIVDLLKLTDSIVIPE
jgi:hypothetical protein